MKTVKFKLNLKGLNELMKGPEIQSVLEAKGQEVAARAEAMSSDSKAEYRVRTKPLRWIAVTNVSADNREAMKENYENNTLLKALK